jgi:molecular chaperone DnaK
VNENRDKVGDVSRIEASIAEVRRVSQGEDLAAIKKATDELQQVSHAMAEHLYKATQGAGASQGARGAQSDPGVNVKDGEVVDAEYAEAK